MLHTAHHAIKVRLTMWKTFFETMRDDTPTGATDTEYGLDNLIELARQGNDSHLHDLADVCELMAQNYILRENNRIAELLMRDDESDAPPASTKPMAFTMDELDAALVDTQARALAG